MNINEFAYFVHLVVVGGDGGDAGKATAAKNIHRQAR